MVDSTLDILMGHSDAHADSECKEQKAGVVADNSERVEKKGVDGSWELHFDGVGKSL